MTSVSFIFKFRRCYYRLLNPDSFDLYNNGPPLTFITDDVMLQHVTILNTQTIEHFTVWHISWETLKVRLSVFSPPVRGHVSPHTYNVGFALTAPTLLWATLCYIQIRVVETPGHWVMWVGGWGFRQPFSFGSLSRDRTKQCRDNFLILWFNRANTHTHTRQHNVITEHEQRKLSCHVTLFACLALIKKGKWQQASRGGGGSGFPQIMSLTLGFTRIMLSFSVNREKGRYHLTVLINTYV